MHANDVEGITYPLGHIGIDLIIFGPFKMAFTNKVHNRGFCTFYYFTHGSILGMHANDEYMPLLLFKSHWK